MPEERLQKLLSQAGVTSRRKAEEMIVEGRVTVNGKTVTALGSKADLETDHIKVDGQLLHSPRHHTYIALNKPKACMTTVSDPEGRQTVMHLMRGVRERVFPVGRLDYHSEGLLLLTSDGEFAHRLMDPANHVTKVYVVKVTGALTEEQEKLFREGIPMHGRKTAPAEIKLIKHGANPWYEVKITEGRQNQIRVMFKHLGKLVEKLRRVKIGFLELDLPPGRYRSLTPPEVAKFRRLLKLDEAEESAPAQTTATPAIAAPKPAVIPKPQTAKPKRGPRNAGKRELGSHNQGPRKFALPKGARPAWPERKTFPPDTTPRSGSSSGVPRPVRSRAAGPRKAGPIKAGPRSNDGPHKPRR
jgi:23S rRNA pseudouridine2605 synthase